jgi:hypothetical protein
MPHNYVNRNKAMNCWRGSACTGVRTIGSKDEFYCVQLLKLILTDLWLGRVGDCSLPLALANNVRALTAGG